MYLGSCRHKLPDYKDDDSAYVFIFNQFAKLNIKAFFYIGGNDSMVLYLNYPIMPAKTRATSGLSEFQRPLTTIYA